MLNTKVVTRFAPSPTGLLHAGNYRTALFSYIFSLQNNIKLIPNFRLNLDFLFLFLQ